MPRTVRLTPGKAAAIIRRIGSPVLASATIRNLGRETFEVVDIKGKQDAVISKDGNRWVVEVFDSTVENSADAFLHSDDFTTLGEALMWVIPGAGEGR